MVAAGFSSVVKERRTLPAAVFVARTATGGGDSLVLVFAAAAAGAPALPEDPSAAATMSRNVILMAGTV
jgi:hypothetical protein